MKRIASSIGLGLAALVAGCGGGGGSPGDTQLEYKITLRADQSQLPLNIGGVGPGKGTYAPFTTILYVNATEGGRPVLGSEDAFACNVAGGLNTGSLYYLDGDPEHEDDDGNPLAYRSITLGANSGGNSFHFHAGTTAGTARITCTITDPRDQQVKAASVDITVGGAPGGAGGMPASVNVQATDPRTPYLGSRNNPNSVPNSIALQAIIRDEANQQVANPGAANLQVSIVDEGEAAEGARLIRGAQWGSVIQTSSHDGVADFHLASGPKRGVILLQLVADRWDNDVTNGVQFPVAQRLAVPVVDGIAKEPLEVKPQTVTATCNRSTSYALEASGGVPPYHWQALGGLPAGLSLSSDGVLSGVPDFANGANVGAYAVAVRVTDGAGTQATLNLTIDVQAGDCKPLAIDEAKISAEKDEAISYALSATGGTPPYKWKSTGVPTGLSVSDAGVLSGSVSTAGTYTFRVDVTDTKGVTVSGSVTVTITEP